MLESAYEQCLCYELSFHQITFQRQVPLPVSYEGIHLDCGYVIDLLVGDSVIVELKSCESILPVHEAPVADLSEALPNTSRLLINFCVPVLKDGIRRLIL